MNIKIACVGKLKERYWQEACDEYEKRISRFARLAVEEVADEKKPDESAPALQKQAMEREGIRLLSRIRENEHVIALTIGGTAYSSEAFAARLETLLQKGAPLSFVIGGSMGLSPAVLARADERLSLSHMTFPHRIARVVLLEQLYRAFKILNRETYHT